jgi:hypothetical protein
MVEKKQSHEANPISSHIDSLRSRLTGAEVTGILKMCKMHILENEVNMNVVTSLLGLLGIKNSNNYKAQIAALSARPQFSNFSNVRGNNARTLNLNHQISTSWTKTPVWN